MAKQNIARRAERILEIAKRMADKSHVALGARISDIQLHYDGYAEPGYSSDTGLVATGNWNDITIYSASGQKIFRSNLPHRVCNLLEKMGIECEWEDEWRACHECGQLVRTQSDSYSWLPSYYIDVNCGSLQCIDCVEADPKTYLESIENNPDMVNTFRNINPEDHGYVKINDQPYQTGYHPGQTDSPHKVLKELEKRGYTRVLFDMVSVGQFDSSWNVYVTRAEKDSIEKPNKIIKDKSILVKNKMILDIIKDKEVKDYKIPANVIVEQKKKEVPCKFCKTSLWEDETPCWRCGGDNPTK